MTLDEFKAWARDHATAFGMSDPNDAAMLLSWYEPFAFAGFIVADLRAATATMVAKSAPQFRSDHLRLIQSNAVISARNRAIKAIEVKDEFGTWSCKHCSGSGWVTVPHPNSLAEGLMVRGLFLAVTCKCGKGMATAASEKKPMSFERYERWNPDWLNQLLTWDEGKAKMARATSVAQQHDKKQPHGIINRLSDQFRMPKKEPTKAATAPVTPRLHEHDDLLREPDDLEF